MQIENLNLVARPRTGWQALDLGIMLARRWYVPLLICFAVPLIAVLVVCTAIFSDSPNLALFIVWWLKPLYERIPLSFLSTSIFGEVPTVRQALGRWRSCVLPGLLPALTYLRLSPTRSFKAPILVLEGLRGTAQNQRYKVLNASQGSEATWLTVISVHVEAFLNLGLVAFIALLLPEPVFGALWDAYLQGLEPQQAWLNNLLYYLCIALVGPFYVAAGFALYINRRVELEAWDIELGFRKIVRRLAQTSTLVIVLSLTNVFSATPAHAEDVGPAEESKSMITDVLASEDYHQKDTYRYPAFFDNWNWNSDDEQKKSSRGWDLSWLAFVLEISLWVLGFALILWLVKQLGLMERLGSTPDDARPMPPEKLFGMALDSKALPADILQAAEDSWRSSDQRAALSLLLRGWLLNLIVQYGCRFREGDTEADCLQVVRTQTEIQAQASFTRLVGAWQRVAYAHQTTTPDEFDQLKADWTAQWVVSSD